MSKDINVRWGWLKAMYIYTIVGAGDLVRELLLSTTSCDPYSPGPVKIQSFWGLRVASICRSGFYQY